MFLNDLPYYVKKSLNVRLPVPFQCGCFSPLTSRHCLTYKLISMVTTIFKIPLPTKLLHAQTLNQDFFFFFSSRLNET